MTHPKPFRHNPRRPAVQTYVVLFSDGVSELPWNGRRMTLRQALRQVERLNHCWKNRPPKKLLFSIGEVR